MTRERHVAEEYTDKAGYEINLDELKRKLEANLEPAAAYLAKDLTNLSELSSYSMDILVSDGSPDQSAGRHAFGKAWDAAAQRLLDERKKLAESVQAFAAAMREVYETYHQAESDNAGHFQSLTNR